MKILAYWVLSNLAWSIVVYIVRKIIDRFLTSKKYINNFRALIINFSLIFTGSIVPFGSMYYVLYKLTHKSYLSPVHRARDGLGYSLLFGIIVIIVASIIAGTYGGNEKVEKYFLFPFYMGIIFYIMMVIIASINLIISLF